VPERTLAGDLNGDCTVDEADLAILTDRWLEGTIEIVAAEPLSGAGYLPQGGYDGLGAVAFTGTESYLDVDGAVFNGIAGPSLTVSLWLYGDAAFQPFANDAVFHASGAGGFTMQLMCPDSQGRVVFDHGIAPARVVFDHGIAPVDRVVWDEAAPADWEGQWNHYAVVKDATRGVQQIYHNGRLVAENAGAFQSTPNSGGMRIGATNQPIPQRLYHGKVDDFRMYAAVLPPVTPADINGDGVVDQADRDILEANMGEVQLWP